MSLRVAVLSVHTCPLALLGGKETGGMNVYVRELARALARMRVQADVFTRSQNPTIPRVSTIGEGVRVVHLPAGPEGPLAREKVHDHLDEFVDGVEAFRIGRGVEYDLIHAHYWLSGAVGLTLRERWGVPLVQMFHTLARLKNDATRDGAEREPELRIAGEARIVAAADRIVAATTVERARLVSHYGADAERIAVIPCGVDTTLFAPGDRAAARAALGLDDRPRLLYVGRLAPIKGLETLLDGMARLHATGSRAHLTIVGGDADEAMDGHEGELRARLRRLDLHDAVTFVGAQPQERLRAWYVAADATVLPSYYESFGMVALEAMACGSPVVATRVGGLQTTVRDRVTGLLVPDHDSAALADTLAHVLDDEDLRWRLGREGVRWAAQHRWPCVAEAVCREYAALVDRARLHLDTGYCK
ncbi:MAG TPA: glycosyltransferase [Methylomirabilota bacterium]|nr:glycosyltransferase [Methylomirabilota bacterium]